MSKERHWLPGSKRRNAALITDAPITVGQDRHHREKVYTILQLSRIPFLILSAVAYVWMENWFLSIIFFLISIPLPWISVVIANGHGRSRDRRSQAVYKPAAYREWEESMTQQLETGVAGELSTSPEPEIIDVEDD